MTEPTSDATEDIVTGLVSILPLLLDQANNGNITIFSYEFLLIYHENYFIFIFITDPNN